MCGFRVEWFVVTPKISGADFKDWVQYEYRTNAQYKQPLCVNLCLEIHGT